MCLEMHRHFFGMSIVLSMAPLLSLCHNDQNEVKHDISGHGMLLVPALLSYDANCIISSTILFIETSCDMSLMTLNGTTLFVLSR